MCLSSFFFFFKQKKTKIQSFNGNLMQASFWSPWDLPGSFWNPQELGAQIPACCWRPPHPPTTPTYIFKHLQLCLRGATGKQQPSLGGTGLALEADGDAGWQGSVVAGQGGRVSAPSHHTAQTCPNHLSKSCALVLATAGVAGKPRTPLQHCGQPPPLVCHTATAWDESETPTSLGSQAMWQASNSKLGLSCIRYDSGLIFKQA